MLSIIVPAYNVEKHILRTLDSIKKQTSKNFELIIVNDGSKDNTLSVIEEIMMDGSIENYKLISQVNGGVSSARNRGIKEATGDYLLFIDGDDYLSLDAVRQLEEEVDKSQADIIAWPYDNVNEDKTLISNYSDRYSISAVKGNGIDTLRKSINGNCWIWICSAIFKKSLVIENNIWFFDGCTNGEDQEFIFKALSIACKVSSIEGTLSYYVHRSSSISNSYNIRKFDAIKAISRVVEFIYCNYKNKHLDICDKLQNDYALKIFTSIFLTNTEQYAFENNTSLYTATRNTELQLEKYYPDLLSDIKMRIIITRTRKVSSSSLTIISKYIFRVSPVFYVYVSHYAKLVWRTMSTICLTIQ